MCFAKCIVLHFGGQACPASPWQDRCWAGSRGSQGTHPPGAVEQWLQEGLQPCALLQLSTWKALNKPHQVYLEMFSQLKKTLEEHIKGRHLVTAALRLFCSCRGTARHCPHTGGIDLGYINSQTGPRSTPAGPFSWVPYNHGSAAVRATQCRMCWGLWCEYAQLIRSGGLISFCPLLALLLSKWLCRVPWVS